MAALLREVLSCGQVLVVVVGSHFVSVNMRLPVAVKWSVNTVAVIAVVLGLAWLIKSCGTDNTDKIPIDLHNTLDSLDATKPAFDRTADSIVTVVIRDTVYATRNNATAERVVREAAAIRLIADSIANLARLHRDSAALWEEAYNREREAYDTLKAAYISKDSAYQFEASARRALMTVYVRDTLRRHEVEVANIGLRKVVADLDKPCRVVGPVPCPSRTVTMVVTAVTTAIAIGAVKK